MPQARPPAVQAWDIGTYDFDLPPHLIELEQRYRARGLVVLGVSDEAAETQNAFARQAGINYTLLQGREGLPAPFGSVNALPTTFVVGPDGRIIDSPAPGHRGSA